MSRAISRKEADALLAEAGLRIDEPSRPDDDQRTEATTWEPVDLAPLLVGEPLSDPPSVLRRDGGPALFYAAKVNDVHGEPESGKGLLVQVAIRQEILAGAHVLYLDFENDPASIVDRLLDLGVPVDAIADRFHYVRPEEPLPGPVTKVLSAVLAVTPTLAIVDGVTDALDLHGFDGDKNRDVAKFRRLLSRPLAAAGPAVVEVDHVTKDPETRGRGAIGAQHKRAGVDGASYEMQLVHPFGRGRSGMSRVVVRKDKPGFVRAAGDRVGEFVLASDPDGVVTVAEIKSFGAAPDEPFRPTALMERVSRHLEDAEEPRSQRAILEAVTGKRDALVVAIGCLVAEGFVEREPVGRSMLHRSVRPFREEVNMADRSPVPPTVPQRSPGNGLDDRSPRSPRICNSGERGTVQRPLAEAGQRATVPPAGDEPGTHPEDASPEGDEVRPLVEHSRLSLAKAEGRLDALARVRRGSNEPSTAEADRGARGWVAPR